MAPKRRILPQDLADLRRLNTRYREHYNRRRPHQSFNQSTPEIAWQTLEHRPAIEPIHLSVMEAKAAEYLRNRRLKQVALSQASIAVSKTGEIIDAGLFPEPATSLAANQILIEVMRDQRKVLHKGQHITVLSTLAGRQYCRTVTDEEFPLSDPDTGEVVMSFPLPMMAMHQNGKFIASYSIRGIQMMNATVHWERKAENYRKEYPLRETQMPEIFTQG